MSYVKEIPALIVELNKKTGKDYMLVYNHLPILYLNNQRISPNLTTRQFYFWIMGYIAGTTNI